MKGGIYGRCGEESVSMRREVHGECREQYGYELCRREVVTVRSEVWTKEQFHNV